MKVIGTTCHDHDPKFSAFAGHVEACLIPEGIRSRQAIAFLYSRPSMATHLEKVHVVPGDNHFLEQQSRRSVRRPKAHSRSVGVI
jgi:hypothetical protein